MPRALISENVENGIDALLIIAVINADWLYYMLVVILGWAGMA